MINDRQRRPRVQGTHNFRDVGGYETTTGMVRWGTLYRSDSLHELTDQGRTRLQDLRVSRIVDLRKPSERAVLPPALGNWPIEVREVAIYDALTDLEVELWPTFDLSVYYEGLVRRRGRQLALAVDQISSAEGPVVVHCTAGKDRTGLVVALTQRLLGVSRGDIAADYAISEALLAGEWAERMAERFRVQQGLPDTVDPAGIVSGSPAAAMLGVLDLIEGEFGGAHRYLKGHGLTDESIDRLEALLVVQAEEVVDA